MSARWPRWPTLIVVAALAAHLAVVVSLLREPLDASRAPPDQRSFVWPLFADTTHRRGPAADFFGVYDAGVQPASPEDLYVDITRPDMVPTRVPYGYPFRYLPAVAYTFAPALRILPPRAAYVGWVFVVEAALAAAIATLWRAAPSSGTRVFCATILLLSFPYFLELYMGQFTFVSMALTLAGVGLLAGSRGPRLRSAGIVAFGVSCLLKLLPLVVAPAIVKKRGGLRVVLGVLAVVIVSSALYFPLHPAAWEAFLRVNGGGKMDGLDAGNHGLLYVAYRLTKAAGVTWSGRSWSTVAVVWQIVALSAVGVLVLAARGRSVVFGAATLIAGFVLSYVHVWEHHYSATILAGLAILVELARADGRGSRRVYAVGVALVLLALPTPFVLLDPHPDPAVWDPSPAWGALAILPPLCKVLPTVVVIAVALHALVRDGLALPAPSACR